MHKTFHEKLRMLRKEKKLSQVEVGKILHYGYTAISNYENGRNEPTLTDLCRLADFFDVSTDFLLGRTEDRQSHCPLHWSIWEGSSSTWNSVETRSLSTISTFINNNMILQFTVLLTLLSGS